MMISPEGPQLPGTEITVDVGAMNGGGNYIFRYWTLEGGNLPEFVEGSVNSNHIVVKMPANDDVIMRAIYNPY